MMVATESYYANTPRSSAAIVCESAYLAQLTPSLKLINDSVRSMWSDLSAPKQMRELSYGRASPTATQEIDFARTEAAMRQIAGRQGIDFDNLVQEASEHFQGTSVNPHAVDLTEEDINRLMEDDDQALRD